jgi:hypothetical protein
MGTGENMASEDKRHADRVADILVEALAVADSNGNAKVLTYLITLALMEADRDFRSREYFQESPPRHPDERQTFRLSC